MDDIYKILLDYKNYYKTILLIISHFLLIRKSVGVFYCGPEVLSNVLHKCSNKYSKIQGGARFFYNKENF